MKKIKVLILSSMYPRNSNSVSGIFIHQQIKNLSKIGCQIRVISPIPFSPLIFQNNPKRKGYAETPLFDLIENIPIYYPRYLRFPGKWFHCLSCYSMYLGIRKITKKIIEDFKPNILHVHTATPMGPVGLFLKKKFNIPLICSLRGSDINTYPHYNWLTLRQTKGVISKTDQLITVSKALKKEVEKIAIPKHKIQVIYNGCDLEKFRPKQTLRIITRKKLNIPENSDVLIFVGGLKKEKGVNELIESFISLSNKNPNLYLIIIGDGSQKSFLIQKISQAKLENKCHLISQQPHHKIPDLLNASDILILPTYNEGLPNVVIEAMACSLPVITTRVGGIPELIKNGKTGILIDKKDILSLKKSILKLIENKQIRIKMGYNERRIIKQKFSWKKNAENVKKIYEELI